MTRSDVQLRQILIAYATNELGTWLGYVALTVAVYDHTSSVIATAALLVTGRFLPAPLVPALVARIETSNRRAQLSALYCIEALLTLGLVAATWHFWLPAVLVLATLEGTVALATSALLRAAAVSVGGAPEPAGGAPPMDASPAMPPDSERRLRAVNARMNLVLGATAATGPAIAGLVVAATSSSAALAVETVALLACAALVARLQGQVGDRPANVKEGLAETWRHVSGLRKLRGLLLCEAVALVFFASAGPVEVALAKTTLHAGDVGYGLMLAVWGGGMVVGGIIFAKGGRLPLGLLLVAGSLAVACAYVGMGLAPTLAFACGAAVVGGIGNGVQWASLISAVQLMTPNRLLQRVMAVVEAIGSLCPAIGFIMGGVIAAAVTPRAAFVVAGAGAAAVTVALARLARGGLVPREQPAEAPPARDLVAT